MQVNGPARQKDCGNKEEGMARVKKRIRMEEMDLEDQPTVKLLESESRRKPYFIWPHFIRPATGVLSSKSTRTQIQFKKKLKSKSNFACKKKKK